MTKMKVLAVIPARGGSRGVPLKNLKKVMGKSLIEHAVLSAKASKLIDRVVVSTDHDGIAKAALRYGAEVVKRPAQLSGSKASSESALLHALEYLKERENYRPDLLVFLQCTAPLMLPKDIDGTIRCLVNRRADSAFAAAPFHGFLWRENGRSNVEGMNHDKRKRLPRQKIGNQFLEAGSVYVMRTEGFLKYRHRFFGRTVLYPIPSSRHLEIDEEADLDRVHAVGQTAFTQERLRYFPQRVRAVLFDFDGVFTDNRVRLTADGKEEVVCSRSDGLGVERLKKAGVRVAVISSEKNPVTKHRCRKLGIPCFTGVESKHGVLRKWARQKGLKASEIIYVGNDINDLSCFLRVGLAVAVRDAHPEVLRAAHFVLQRKGGEGAVRELADLVIRSGRRL